VLAVGAASLSSVSSGGLGRQRRGSEPLERLWTPVRELATWQMRTLFQPAKSGAARARRYGIVKFWPKTTRRRVRTKKGGPKKVSPR
jgi:hypothetical protein